MRYARSPTVVKEIPENNESPEEAWPNLVVPGPDVELLTPSSTTSVSIEVRSEKSGVPSCWVSVEGVAPEQVVEVQARLEQSLKSGRQVSRAVTDAFVAIVRTCPKANPSDLWQHIVYRVLRSMGYSDQQWRRISGFAFEHALVELYQRALAAEGLRLRVLPAHEARRALTERGLDGVGAAKVDLFLEGIGTDGWKMFGVVHAKVSVAERIQDDVPASLACMRAGILSVMVTLDSKSFPPPHGDGVNYGELGGRLPDVVKERPKRAYIESEGQFDALFSYNLRTPASPLVTASGKRIHTLGFSDGSADAFVQVALNAWLTRRP